MQHAGSAAVGQPNLVVHSFTPGGSAESSDPSGVNNSTPPSVTATSSGSSGNATPQQQTLDPQQQQQEKDKRAVYRHPLFPLLVLLFEKCEQATNTNECPSSASFDNDIQAFVQNQERERKPFFSDDPEVDNLMVKAIQVLRIHLLELEKVNELCKDFCNRYIACLKGKMNSENILRGDTNYNMMNQQSSQTMIQQNQTLPQCPQQAQLQAAVAQQQQIPSQGFVGNVLQAQGNVTGHGTQTVAINQAQLITAGGAVYQPLTMVTPQGVVTQTVPGNGFQIQTSNSSHHLQQSHIIHGSTPLSQIGVSQAPPPIIHSTHSTSMMFNNMTPVSSHQQSEHTGCEPKKSTKRGVLPKQATNIMRSWLFQHIVHPYPTEDEKRQIAVQTNLTLLQVNNWFINARRRILQPMLEASNPEAVPKSKKAKSSSRPPQSRFWPASLAMGQIPHSSSSNNSSSNSPVSDIVTTSTANVTPRHSSPETSPVHVTAGLTMVSLSNSGHSSLASLQSATLSPMLHNTSPTLGSMMTNGGRDSAGSELTGGVIVDDLSLSHDHTGLVD